MPLSWYPRNFTNPEISINDANIFSVSDNQLYGVQLGLYVIGYKETKDDKVCFTIIKKFF